MSKLEAASRAELWAADDAAIEDAVAFADPMVLRGLVYQLTGDPEVAQTGVRPVQAGFAQVAAPAGEADVALLRGKGAGFLHRRAVRLPSQT
jgi:4-hydroxyacetophenone monooxygenase